MASKNKNEQSEEIEWLGLGILSPKGLVLEAYGGETPVCQVVERASAMPEKCNFVVVKAKLAKIRRSQLANFIKKSRAVFAEPAGVSTKPKKRR